ncbi:MAG TPA: hypothetical protein VHQ20_01910, partial [Patescibacteria group bacterium]|nr:hypothetical protein [Patescibacteria group bacterium]
MIDPNYISQICAELGLNPEDQTVRKILERLISSRPNVPIDEKFIAQLRSELQNESNSYSAQKPSFKLRYFTSLTLNRVLASALVVMIVVAASGFWYIQKHADKPLFQTPGQKEANQLLSGKYAVTGVGEQSFGDLNKVSIVAAKPATAQSGMGGGANLGNSMETAPASAADSKMIAPGEPYPPTQPTQFSFNYAGKTLPQLDANQGVLKRIEPQQPPSLIERIISMLSFGLVDLSKFTDVKLQNFSFVEDHDYGYYVNVDMVNGDVGIYQNYDKWPQLQNLCTVNGCPPQPTLKPEDVPADDEMFKATDAFLDQYGISKEAYG